MAQATVPSEIGVLQRTFSEEECTAAWRQLPEVQRSALLLARFFPGSVIIHSLEP
jgi:hypothetical protein